MNDVRLPLIGLLCLNLAAPPGQLSAADLEAQQRQAFVAAFVRPRSITAGMSTILFDGTATVVNKRRAALHESHPAYFGGGFEEDDVVLVEEAIQGRRYFVVQTDGPSADPAFYFIDAATRKEGGWIPGDILVLSTTGALHVFQRSDSLFAKRTEWRFADGRVTELRPPEYKIGLRTITTDTLVVTDRLAGRAIARLEKNAPIEVISSDDKDRDGATAFLVRTSAGQVGYVLVPHRQCPESVVLGLCWMGD